MPGFIAKPEDIPVVLLAGGRSSRMGTNKAFVSLAGESLLARVSSKVARQQHRPIALNADADWPDTLEMALVPDRIPGKLGPLAGVLAAMQDTLSRYPQVSHVATIPIDTPFFPPDLVARLANAIQDLDEIAIAVSLGQDHPVFGLWPVSAAPDLERWIVSDEKRRIRDFLARHNVRRVDFPAIETSIGALDPFFNINTPADLAEAKTWLAALENMP
ncbi:MULTISPECIES: molybdenum cofactor guanylyltransferase MobA [unclassified Rhizobium]|jgi:molybdopterin-guanine dinucleotide biosynthesis protein A|uniref:molybdenum cofactor guanylyltransferase MobA n=1 Tax=unclassified Rhizobium TaxID=2613769 RepID=UPI000645D1BD|nr:MULTISPECIES: molybdenum cofactor guanylyltransferase MobA [unclassified Rhizobium]MBN8951555.1 molybdenum cofactor guanylyltransferase MobA [Rhizobium tropici]OJY67708.1 MAG: molybdenum cofactor guanylyltransferase [Rhizobium sp. 60-20]RKD60183.1 molybdenum cofactor guanylyltransferase [Rhizobium sp. WW_1]